MAGMRRGRRGEVGVSSKPSWDMHLQSMLVGDECEEHVPLSQDATPFKQVSYVGLMEEAMVTSPSAGKKTIQDRYVLAITGPK
ncbi:hypothetical protein GOP47_0021020 [Adiantum capillus-veneris]|uniref:Uncharacterized protein n=1 Tax=Adiantum capillus-veneris TaxID=13818 RepID=A0A9D4UAT1_ADICA|nr:hypothetical protein GOP47_0021020 [Adiantum capillus-veneris]